MSHQDVKLPPWKVVDLAWIVCVSRGQAPDEIPDTVVVLDRGRAAYQLTQLKNMSLGILDRFRSRPLSGSLLKLGALDQRSTMMLYPRTLL